MNVDQLAESLRRDQSFMENVVRWEELPAREARYGDFPPELDARLLPVLRQRGRNPAVQPPGAKHCRHPAWVRMWW